MLALILSVAIHCAHGYQTCHPSDQRAKTFGLYSQQTTNFQDQKGPLTACETYSTFSRHNPPICGTYQCWLIHCLMTFFTSEANQITCDHFYNELVILGHLSLCSKTFLIWFTNKLFLILFEVRAVFCTGHIFLFIMYLFIFTWQRDGVVTFGD